MALTAGFRGRVDMLCGNEIRNGKWTEQSSRSRSRAGGTAGGREMQRVKRLREAVRAGANARLVVGKDRRGCTCTSSSRNGSVMCWPGCKW